MGRRPSLFPFTLWGLPLPLDGQGTKIYSKAEAVYSRPVLVPVPGAYQQPRLYREVVAWEKTGSVKRKAKQLGVVNTFVGR